MTSIMQLVLFTLGLLLFGFGLFVGLYPQGDQTVGILLMFAGLVQAVYGLSVGNEWFKILPRSGVSYSSNKGQN